MPVCVKTAIRSIQPRRAYGASIENLRCSPQIYANVMTPISLNVLTLLCVNGAPDGWKDEKKVNMILNELPIRNVWAQI